MRVVLDTNVLASAMVAAEGGTLARIVEACGQGGFELLASEHILHELGNTLSRPYFRSRGQSRHGRLLSDCLAAATHATVEKPAPSVATHPEDDLILATAVSGQADYLVTGDVQLQIVGHYQGVTIVSPAQFLLLLDAQRDAGAP